MRGVAGTLEAVELEGFERIGRRQLVDDEDMAARPGDSGQLGDDELRPRDVVERPHRPREIERP